MTSPPAALAADRFSTFDLPERDRLPAWRDYFGREILGVDFEPLTDAPVYAEMTLHAMAGLQITSGSISAARYARTRELMSDGRDDLYFLITNATAGTFALRGHDLAFGDGDALLISASEATTLVSASTLTFLDLRLPRTGLETLLPGLGEALTRPVSRNNEALQLLISYVGLLRRETPPAPELQRLAVAHVLDLVALAIGATRDAAEIANGRGRRAARLSAIKADVVQNLGADDLSVVTVAKRQLITPRYVQLLFESEGTTFSQFVMRQRLAQVHRALSDARLSDLTISAIAFKAGFGDLSTFNHAFRRHYAASPSEVRAAASEAPSL